MSSSVAMAPASAAVAVAVAAMTITTAGAKKPDSTARASRKSQKSGQSQQATAVKQPKGKAAKAEHKAASAVQSMAADAAKASSPKKSDATDTKKHSSKQSFKIAREKERKEKQLKQTGGLVNDVVTTQTDTLDAMALRLQEMEQDSVKSRNHKLFLAPSLRHSGPCWSGHQARDARFDSVAERLHEEILEYAEYTRTTVDAMTVHIEQMISHVGRCVRALWPKSRMEPFGSYSTGIWLPSSDVDLVILGVVEIHDRMLTVKSLRQLAKALEKQPWVESLVVLESAKIPVLKLVTAESSVPIDITFESTATHSGLLARDLIKRYADEMPELYPLAVVFKQLLRERDLNDAYTGGLSSYSIVLMIIHFQLLCRYGHKCFKAAALFASGSPLPRPSDLLAEEAEEAERQRQAELQKKNGISAAESDKKPSITSSFAAVVTRSKSLKRPASEVGRCGSEEGSSPKQSPAQPFSYAAVAAGIAKVTEDGKAKAAAVPSSYAAAVAAPAPKVVKPKASHGSPAKSAGSKVGANDADSISVTSSTADTEDSASCSDSSTTTSAHDDTDDDVKQASLSSESELQEPPRELSLGERTMTILEFYGILFDYRKNGLSVRDGGYIYRLADHVGASGDLCKKLPALVIEDPIHPDRNVSASSFAFSKVVAVFEDSYYALKYFRPTRFTPSALSCLLSTSGHTLHHLTKPKTPLKK